MFASLALMQCKKLYPCLAKWDKAAVVLLRPCKGIAKRPAGMAIHAGHQSEASEQHTGERTQQPSCWEELSKQVLMTVT